MNLLKTAIYQKILSKRKSTKSMYHLKEGDKAPDFSAKNEKGEQISLKDFKGKKLALFFYPAADTSGCTAEACSLRDHYKELQLKGINVLGVSPDTSKKQSNFIKKYSFPYSLLADEDQTVLKTYGVWGEKKFMGRTFDGVHRTTFLIDEQGMIEKIYDKVDTDEHAEQILNSLK